MREARSRSGSSVAVLSVQRTHAKCRRFHRTSRITCFLLPDCYVVCLFSFAYFLLFSFSALHLVLSQIPQ